MKFQGPEIEHTERDRDFRTSDENLIVRSLTIQFQNSLDPRNRPRRDNVSFLVILPLRIIYATDRIILDSSRRSDEKREFTSLNHTIVHEYLHRSSMEHRSTRDSVHHVELSHLKTSKNGSMRSMCRSLTGFDDSKCCFFGQSSF